jgi:replicative DNA helicase
MPDTDVETEASVLSLVLIDVQAYDSIADLWRPEAFFHPAHRAIAEGLGAVIREKHASDAVLVAAWLKDNGYGGFVPDLFPLARTFGVSAGVRDYAERVNLLWMRRRARQVAQALVDNDAPGLDGIRAAVAELSLLESAGPGRDARPFAELLQEKLERLSEQAKAGPNAPTDAIETGFRRLDQLTGGFRPGMPALIAARPGVGKSALLIALLDNIASRGVPCGVFQLEDEAGAMADRAIARRARVNSTLLRHGSSLRPEHWDRIFSLDLSHRVWVDDSKGLTPSDLAARIRRMKREHDVRLVFIDHLGEMSLEYQGKNDRHDLALGRGFRALRKVAHDLGICLVALHQLNRDVDKRSDETPRLSDLRDSGDLEAVARVVMFLSRPEGKPGFVIDVAKNTNGPKGRCTLDWLEDYMTVQEPAQVA